MYKLVESTTGESEMYDLTVDPYENTDLVASGTAPMDIQGDFQYLVSLIRGDNVSPLSYAIVDNGQDACYDDSLEITCPAGTEAFSGQDAQHPGNVTSTPSSHRWVNSSRRWHRVCVTYRNITSPTRVQTAVPCFASIAIPVSARTNLRTRPMQPAIFGMQPDAMRTRRSYRSRNAGLGARVERIWR